MNPLVLSLVGGIVVIIILALWIGVTGTGGSPKPMRSCPVCGARLDQDERVYADQVEHADQPHELTIKGCSRCYDRD